MSESVGLVVPALRPDVPRLRTYLRELEEAVDPAVIRIELDAPSDDCIEEITALDVEVSISPVRRGKGRAITAGFDALETDVKAFVDADGSTAAPSVATLVQSVTGGSADLAVGSRRHRGATVTGRSPRRRIMSGTFATVAAVITGIHLTDFQCGAKAIGADAWDELRGTLYEPGFAWDLELLWNARRHGYTIAEVPIVWEERPGSTVAPYRTASELGRLLGRIAEARVRRRPQLTTEGVPLIDRSTTEAESS